MKRTQSAFTLVELLVVITIIAILAGLLLPAVNAARETARRTQCQTQIRNLALAAIQHENSKDELPGFVQNFGIFQGGADPTDPGNYAGSVPRHIKIGTWAVALLPWLDAQPTYEHWTQDRYPVINDGAGDTENTTGISGVNFHELAAPNLAILQCPSNPVSEGSHGLNSYISNNGVAHSASVTIGWVPSQDRANGAFNCKYYADGTMPVQNTAFQGPSVRLDDFKDGQGNTLLFSENVQAFPWHRAGLIDGADLESTTDDDVLFDLASENAESARYIHGAVWHYEDSDSANAAFSTLWNQNGTGTAVAPIAVNSFHLINGGGTSVSDDIFTRTIGSLADARDLARPSSAHVDGVNAGMADGGTRFIQQSIDYRVYQALMTPRGKSSNVPWPEFVLTDEVE